MSLERLNALSSEEAHGLFLSCCGSRAWAKAMTAGRPYPDAAAMAAKATANWNTLAQEDWLEAFAAHPRIGAPKVDRGTQFGRWSNEEQRGVASASDAISTELAELNEAYYVRHGFVFLICATGKSAEEMLAELRRRLPRDREVEIQAAAEEQNQITLLRLRRLL